ncbi:Nif11-like leader peptide family RiPP precursor [Synechococcus sp. BIOS-E4-1]|uniref:Nif11-like leader peptide family RiPP precursor n=1 Tax=Synechococcus sp. BIOS-E4-1 TaxID=1400864 RepID=UPI001645FA04|nr:Nif11-like leader peptide family RiPP precursor [Synechococcus sp. BIOS-E4-1]
MAAIDDLMAALSSNPELRQAMTSAITPEDAVKAAADAGYKVTSQELVEAYKSQMSALSDDELASISGGKGYVPYISKVTPHITDINHNQMPNINLMTQL